MRAVVQRVKKAAVKIEGKTVGEIGRGMLVFLGIGADDDDRDIQYICSKVQGLRIFEDGEGKMNLSIKEAGGGVLLVSQFTLHGDCRKGRRPSFSAAMAPDRAKDLYYKTVGLMKEAGLYVETGEFQAMMDVELINDGPVTILLDSKRHF
ncbi:MAG: D-aminoacyl-tRNA deacylase [Bacillota bacterium]|nr:D-aminoacyl-tRNA deacylase [Bacillota bacterium]